MPFGGQSRTTDDLVAGINGLRARSRTMNAAELFTAMADWLELPISIRAVDQPYVRRLAQFVREWQSKSETAALPEFVEYLDYFVQAGGQINLEQESGDAVQLMTVHAAKGLEFDQVFVLRLTHRGFPMASRAAELEFPEALMKEELPKGDFHTQEERRLFYVAITRARERLTLTTVVHKRSRPSIFLEDILSIPQVARQNVEQAAPVSAPAGTRGVPAPAPLLFEEGRNRARVYSRIAAWAEQFRPPVFEPLQLSASGIEAYQKCPQKYLFSYVWGLKGGPNAATTFGNVMHTTIRQFIAALRKGQKVDFEEVETIFRREWTSAGFEDRYQEELYLRDGIEQLRAFHASTLAAPPDVIALEKRFTIECDNGVQVTGRMDQVNRVGPGQVEIIDYKTGKPKTGEAGPKGPAIEHLRPGGPRSARSGAGPAHLLQPAKQPVRLRVTRGKAAARGAWHDPGDGCGHSRARISGSSRLPLQELRLSLSVSRARIAVGAAARGAAKTEEESVRAPLPQNELQDKKSGGTKKAGRPERPASN